MAGDCGGGGGAMKHETWIKSLFRANAKPTHPSPLLRKHNRRALSLADCTLNSECNNSGTCRVSRYNYRVQPEAGSSFLPRPTLHNSPSHSKIPVN